MSRSSTANIQSIDWTSLGIYVGLCLLGCGLVYAAGYDPAAPTSIFDFGTRGGKQVLYFFLAGIVGGVIMLLDPQIFKVLAYPMYGVSILLLVFVMVYGGLTKGAMSWFELPGGFKFQPSEITKFTTCMALATYMSSPQANMKQLPSILTAMGIFLLPCLLVVAQGDPGTALVYLALMVPLYREGLSELLYGVGIVLIILFVASLVLSIQTVLLCLVFLAAGVSIANMKQPVPWGLAWMAGVGVSLWLFGAYANYVLVGAAVFFISALVGNAVGGKRGVAGGLLLATVVFSALSFSVNYLFNDVLKPHQQDRINVWLMPEKADRRGSYYNLRQSKLAIGSGGLVGRGYLNGEMTQGNHVPEQDTDFIFTVMGEEQGFAGAFTVIFLFALLLIRLSMVAERQRSRFTRVYAYSVAGILSLHLLVNVGMTMGLMPVIGIPLPFISYGGSSLLSFTLMLAVLLRFDSLRLLVFR